MLKDVIQVKPLNGYNLWLKFEDGIDGIVDVSHLTDLKGVFAPLQERAYFVQVRVNPDTGTICWQNDADIDPDVLYAHITGTPLPTYRKETFRV